MSGPRKNRISPKKTPPRRAAPGRKPEKRALRQRGLLVFILLGVGLFASVLAYFSAAPPVAEPASSAGKPPAPGTPKYDFYKTLPQREVVIDEHELSVPEAPARTRPQPRQASGAGPAPPTPEKAPAKGQQNLDGTAYLVQAGAFRKQADADRVKAKLALLGIKARIEYSASHNVHRVRIGPIRDAARLAALRQRLSMNNIDSMSIKLDR